MSIIEKLGGYEKAKKLRGTTSNALLDMKTWHVHVDDIDSALLEYRRANNIYEVGDKLVLVGAGTKDVLLEVIEYKYTNDLYRVKVLSTGSSGHIHKDDIRHATDVEIQAGRRL